MKKRIDAAISLFSALSLGLIFCTIDGLTYGCNIFPSHEKILPNLSLFLFISSSAISQLLFGLLTSINSGILSCFIVEAHVYYKQIFHNIQNTDLSIKITNTLLCTQISTLLFCLFSYLLYLTRISGFQSFLPKNVLYGCLASIGLSQLSIVGNELGITTIKDLLLLKVTILLVISILLSLLALYLETRYPDVPYLIPSYILLIFLGFYAVTFAYSRNELVDLKMLNSKVDVSFSFKDVFAHIHFRNIRFGEIFRNFPSILYLALYNMIHMPVNTATFTLQTNVSHNLRKEFRAQCLTNLITALLGTPTYFVCSNSIFFRRCGGKTKLSSILMAPVILTMFFYCLHLRNYLPKIVLLFVPLFICLCYVKSYIYDVFFELKAYKIDMAILSAVAIVCTYFEFIYGLLLGIFLNFIVFFYYYYASVVKKRQLKNYDQKSEVEIEILNDFFENFYDKNLVIVDYIANFVTLKRITRDLREAECIANMVVVDMSKCSYIDWMVRDEIRDIIKNSKSRFFIVNKPVGFFNEVFENMELVHT